MADLTIDPLSAAKFDAAWSFRECSNAVRLSPRADRCLCSATMKNVFLALLVAVAPLNAVPASPQAVEAWQKIAVQKHPAVAQAGSPLNQRFLAIVAAKRKSEPTYFEQADWPMRAADAAAVELRAEEMVAKAKAKADELVAKKKAEADMERAQTEQERAEEIAQWEREWEAQKARWVFERLVFGDSEETIVRKLNLSKLVTPRAVGNTRVELGSRFRWTLGESKFNLDFEMKDGLAAITFDCRPEDTSELDTLIREDWDKLRAAAIERFGQPIMSAEYPTASKLRRGGLTVTDVWSRPDRHIALGLSQDSGKCHTTLRISDPARGVSLPGF